jgi:pimeloyl-ACP methyl ester carboxylesterase
MSKLKSAGPDCRTIETVAGTVEFSSLGTGKALLFVHGGHANCRDILSQKGLSPEKYQLITPSRPGYGNTPLAENGSPERTAGLFVALLDELQIEKCLVYGISAGGLSALAMAALFPERVEKLILASAVSQPWLLPGDDDYGRANVLFRSGVERFTWAMVHAFARLMPVKLSQNFFKEFSNSSKTAFPASDADELCAALLRYRSHHGFMNDIEQKLSPSLLEQIRCETLVLHSRFDQSVPLRHAEFAQKHIPHARLELLDNQWGHMLWIGEDSQQTIRLTEAFIGS